MENTFRIVTLNLILVNMQINNVKGQFGTSRYPILNQPSLHPSVDPHLIREREGCGLDPKTADQNLPMFSPNAPRIWSSAPQYGQTQSNQPVNNSISANEPALLIFSGEGGRGVTRGQFPWMALLGYVNNLGQKSWKCGGTLITSRHVLSAAHCVTVTLRIVRLGEHDTDSDEEPVQDITIARANQYPYFNSVEGLNDIAILHLERSVLFTEFVWPICLPFGRKFRRSSFEALPTIAGWGLQNDGGKPSNILQFLDLPILDNAVCKDRYRKQRKLKSENQFGDTVICAGDLNGGHDSCRGDSGGPMMLRTELDIQKMRYYQIGIISFGIGCSKVDTPGVYTRVSQYIDWIKYEVYG